MTRNHDGMDDRAVSPVIGVILMVAITVILAAVIGAFVLDLGQSQNQSINAGVSFSEDGSSVTVQLTDKGNSNYVEISKDGSCTTSGNTTLASVGDSVEYSSCSPGDTITAVGHKGGDSSVIQNHEVGS